MFDRICFAHAMSMSYKTIFLPILRYAFVTMADDDSADAAVKELNGAVIDGQEVKVDRARGGGGGGGRGGKYKLNYLFFPGNFTFVLVIYYAFSTKSISI